MEKAALPCEMRGLLASARNVHRRLVIAAFAGSAAAVGSHGWVLFAWMALAGVLALAFTAGFSTLWSP